MGTLQANGLLNPATVQVFYGTASGTTITISSFAPGYSDLGNAIGDVVVLKPTTEWANLVSSFVTTGAGAGAAGWNSIGTTPVYNSNNGNKEFTVKYAADLRNTLSPGMKMSVTRAVAPPTQCMAFSSASSQYATKASPSGITFTSAFTCEAWVYLNSYPATGATAHIINRFNNAGTSGGWFFFVRNSGVLVGGFASGSNFTQNETYQSLPLNQWVHVASTVNATTKTITLYINGVAVPAQQTFSAASAVAQDTVDLRIGATGATPANTYFNGYISEARVWSAAQTATQIQNNMAINCVGNETNLVALFQGNGNFNDLTSNANNLTATGGAIATQANNPYNAIEYFSVIAVSYSAPNTTLTLDGGTMNALPNQTLNSPQYSTSANPFGLPTNLKKYVRYVPVCASFATSVQSATQIPGLIKAITIPAGAASVKVTAYAYFMAVNAAGSNNFLSIWQGSNGPSGSGSVNLSTAQVTATAANSGASALAEADITGASGNQTFSVGYHVSGNTGTLYAAPSAPAFLKIECDL
jgi:hypothetical protein